jgi:hypothetical protein
MVPECVPSAAFESLCRPAPAKVPRRIPRPRVRATECVCDQEAGEGEKIKQSDLKRKRSAPGRGRPVVPHHPGHRDGTPAVQLCVPSRRGNSHAQPLPHKTNCRHKKKGTAEAAPWFKNFPR